MLLYKIDFEVDGGAYYRKDSAIVMVYNKEEAAAKLMKLINSINSETCISEIFKTTLFSGDVFTGNHGYTNKMTIL